jgi:glycosyltransferase involved in cell wall biosynthesis
MTTLYLVDPGLLDRNGHHFTVDLALADEAARRGMRAETLANQAVAPDVLAALPACRPVFAFSLYRWQDYREALALAANLVSHNEDMENGLHQALGPVEAGDLILVHTISALHLTGLYLWFHALPPPRPGLCIILRFPPEYGIPAPDHALARGAFQSALGRWRDLADPGVLIATDNDALGRLYEDLAGLKVPVLPIPMRYGPPPTDTAPGSPPRLTWLGGMRGEKGAYPLLSALLAERHRLGGVHFTLQAAGSAGDPFFDQVERALPEADFIRHSLDDADYLALLAASDGILVPYDPAHYDLRTSHIFLEALASGKPVLTTAGTWMDRELARFGDPGLRAPGFDAAAIGTALTAFAGRLGPLRLKAAAAAEACRAAHNPARFLDAILDRIGAAA